MNTWEYFIKRQTGGVVGYDHVGAVSSGDRLRLNSKLDVDRQILIQFGRLIDKVDELSIR